MDIAALQLLVVQQFGPLAENVFKIRIDKAGGLLAIVRRAGFPKLGQGLLVVAHALVLVRHVLNQRLVVAMIAHHLIDIFQLSQGPRIIAPLLPPVQARGQPDHKGLSEIIVGMLLGIMVARRIHIIAAPRIHIADILIRHWIGAKVVALHIEHIAELGQAI